MHLEGVVCGGRWRVALAVLMAFECVSTRGWAQDDRSEPSAPAEPEAAQRAAAAGNLSSWTTSARSNTQRAVGHAVGGYDGAAKKATFDSGAEAQVTDRTALRASVTSVAGSTAGARLEGKVDVLRQETSGVDVAVVGGYESRGFNEVPAVAGTLAIGRRLGKLQLLANVGYARGVEEAEQYGSAGVAGFYQVASHLQVGLDSRFRIDLERDSDEPPGEREWELVAGPAVSYTMGPYAVIAGTGVAANQLRLQPGLNVGVIGYVGLGVAF
jgi:hypothetical protein